MNRRRIASLFLGLAAAVAGLFVSAPPAGADYTVPIRSSAFFGLCLQSVGGSIDAGAAVVQQSCDRSAAQLWRQTAVRGDIIHFVNVHSGLCLNARGGAVDRTPVQQWPCNSISNENWEIADTAAEHDSPLISRVSGTRSHCLDIPGGRETAGLAMQIYRCNGTATQVWTVW